jgi:hypothetical protein
MSLSVITIDQIAQRVTDKLNQAADGTFVGLASGTPIGASFIWETVWDIEAGDLESLAINISPVPESRQVLNRGRDVLREIKVDVAIRKRLPDGTVPTKRPRRRPSMTW